MIWVYGWLGGCACFVAGMYWAGRHRPKEAWQHDFMTGMMVVFHEGEVARNRQFMTHENPYPHGSVDWRAWNFGWSWIDNRISGDEGKAKQ